METYDRILKEGELFMCSGCIGYEEKTGKCEGWKEQLKAKLNCGLLNRYYANSDQIEGLIEEAESGYHWYHENGNLWTCECESCPNCLSGLPHFLSDSPVKCYAPKPFRGFKGEPQVFPTAEDCSSVAMYAKALKEAYPEDYKEESEDMGVADKEYVVVKDFNLDDVSKTDISASVFLQMYKLCDPSYFYETGSEVPPAWVGTPIEHELVLLGFIGDKVCDPVIPFGGCLEWVGQNSYYRLITIGASDYILSNIENGCMFSGLTYKKQPLRLSDLVGKDRLREFKPVNVKVEVVE